MTASVSSIKTSQPHVPIRMNGQTYYRTSEACKRAGISRATFFRWLKAGTIEDVAQRDRRGWRLFTQADIVRIQNEAGRISNLAAT